MALHKIQTKNCKGYFYWISRPVSKMNNKELRRLTKTSKSAAKRMTSKRRRRYLKSEI